MVIRRDDPHVVPPQGRQPHPALQFTEITSLNGNYMAANNGQMGHKDLIVWQKSLAFSDQVLEGMHIYKN